MITQTKQVELVNNFVESGSFYNNMKRKISLDLDQQNFILPKIKSPLRYLGGK